MEDLVSQADLGGPKVLAVFSATWCGPCQMLKPLLKHLEPKHPDIKFYVVDIDAHGEFADSFGVTSVPTLVMLSYGRELRRLPGLVNKAALAQWLNL